MSNVLKNVLAAISQISNWRVPTLCNHDIWCDWSSLVQTICCLYYLGVFIIYCSEWHWSSMNRFCNTTFCIFIKPVRMWDSWAHQPGLIHLSLVHSPGPSVVLCIFNSYSTLPNWPITSLLILFISFSNVFCTIYFIGSPYRSVSYYNYISVWPYYIVIPYTIFNLHIICGI